MHQCLFIELPLHKKGVSALSPTAAQADLQGNQ
jgi:hypothetical protein